MPEFNQQIVFQGIDNVSKTISNIMGKIGLLGTVSSEVNAQFAVVSKTAGVLANKMKLVGLAAAGIATAIFWMSYRTSDAAESLLNLSQKTGVGVEALQKLNYVADQSNVGSENLAMGFRFLNRSIADASNNIGGDAANAFAGLGIQLKDAQGNVRATEDVFYDLSDAFESGADGPTKVATAIKLLGRSGEGLIPILNRGSESLRKQGDQFTKYGNLITKGGLKAIADFNDTVDNALLAIKALGSVIAEVLIPYLEPIVKGFSDWVAANKELVKLKVSEWLADLKAQFTAWLPKLEATWSGIKKVWDMLGGFEGIIKTVAAFMAADLLIAFANFAGAVAVLSKILAASPIGRFVTLLGLVAAAVYALNAAFPELGKTVTGVVDIMYEKFTGFFDWLGTKIRGMLEALHIVDAETSKQEGKVQKGKYQQTLDPATGKIIKKQFINDNPVIAPTDLPLNGTDTAPREQSFSDTLKSLAGMGSGKSEPVEVRVKLDTENTVSNVDIDAPLLSSVSVNSGPMIQSY